MADLSKTWVHSQMIDGASTPYNISAASHNMVIMASGNENSPDDSLAEKISAGKSALVAISGGTSTLAHQYWS